MSVVFLTIFGNKNERSIFTIFIIIFLKLGKVDVSTIKTKSIILLYMLNIIVDTNLYSKSTIYIGYSKYPSFIVNPDYYIFIKISNCLLSNKNPSSSLSIFNFWNF